MVSALAPKNLLSRFVHKHFVADPGGTTSIFASPDGGTTPYYFDMSRVKRALVLVAPSIAGGAITLVEVYASSDVAGATNLTLVRASGVLALDNTDGAANSGGDCYKTEIDAQELAQLGAASGLNLRYLTVKVTNATGTDEYTLDFLGEGMDAFDDQIATVQA